jgi:hypothetical protein
VDYGHVFGALGDVALHSLVVGVVVVLPEVAALVLYLVGRLEGALPDLCALGEGHLLEDVGLQVVDGHDHRHVLGDGVGSLGTLSDPRGRAEAWVAGLAGDLDQILAGMLLRQFLRNPYRR